MNIHWYKFAMDIDPFNINVGTSGININTFPAMKTFTVYIRAARNQATGLIPTITKEMFRNSPRDMVQLHYTHADHWAPATKKAHEAAPDPDLFEQAFAEFKQHVKYDVMTQILRKQYVREDAIMETPAQRLTKITQKRWDPKSRTNGYKVVSEVVTEIETILQEINEDVPTDIPNLATTFVHSLSPTLQRKLLPSVPDAQPADHKENVSNFNQMVSLALIKEQENKDLVRMIQSQTQSKLQGPRRCKAGPTSSTFMTAKLTGPAPRGAMMDDIEEGQAYYTNIQTHLSATGLA